MIEEGREFAQANEVVEATLVFSKALALNPSLDIQPQAKAERIAALSLVESGDPKAFDYARSLTPGVIVTGAVTLDGGELWSFSVESAQTVTILQRERVSRLGIGGFALASGLDPHLKVYGPNLQLVDENDDNIRDSDSALERLFLPEAGTYLIVAGGHKYGSGLMAPGASSYSTGVYELEFVIEETEK